MQSDLEQIKEMVRALPIEDLDELQATISEEKKAKQSKNGGTEKSNWQIERYKKARKWLEENSEKYMNRWVCLEGDELIAHSDDGREVYRLAKEKGVKVPFIHYIKGEPKYYLGSGYELIRD